MAAVAPRFASEELFEKPFVRVNEQTTWPIAAPEPSAAPPESSARPSYGAQADARELAAFFREYEADIGFRSTFSAMLAAASGVALGSGPPAGWDPYADVLDRIQKGARVYRRLMRMDAGHVTVLARLYGPRNGANERPDFGELAPLVSLTSAAQDAREALVLDESTVRSERVAPRVLEQHHARRAELERMFWHEVGQMQKAERQLDRLEVATAELRTAEARLAEAETAIESTAGNVQDRAIARSARAKDDIARLQHHLLRSSERRAAASARLIAGEQLLKQLLDGFFYDGVVRAQLGAITATDRELTVDDALRAMLDAPRRSKGDGDAFRAWRARRTAFVDAVVAQATELRTAALAAYRLSKAGDPPDAPRTMTPRPASYFTSIVTHSVSGASP